MASISPRNSPPPHYSYNVQRLFRSISSREESSFPEPPPSPPPRHSYSPFTLPFNKPTPPSSRPSSPDHKHHSDGNIRSPQLSHRCILSMLKKDGRILSIAVSNGLVYTGSETNFIRVWKLPEFTECAKLKSKAGMVYALAVSNDRVFAAYSDCNIRVWRRTWDGILMHVKVATIPKLGNYVRNYISGKDKKMMKHMGPISSLAINISDDLLYSASTDKTVKVWRISDLKCIETIQAHSEPVNAVAVGDDGVLYTASDDATVKVWRRNFCNGDRPHSLTITLPAKQSPVKALALTTDSGFLYGGCTDGYIHYWVKGWFSGQLQYGGALQGHTHAIMCLTSVASYVVSGSADLTCRVWVREKESQHSCLAVLQGHRGPVRCVSAFTERVLGDNEEGCTVCTGSLDGILKVWRVSYSSSDSTRTSLQASPQVGKEYFEL